MMNLSASNSGSLLFLTALLLLLSQSQAFSFDNNNPPTRRDWLFQTAGIATSGFLFPPIAQGTSGQPIAVLGASGRTGALCVTACLKRGIPVKALTRSGSWTAPEGSTLQNENLLTMEACDVKDTTALQKSLQGCRGVIYAASASKQGGNAQEIDNLGVVQAGSVCLAEKIPRYVVISSTATTRPKSMGYIFTNVMGGIMDQKRLGELAIENAYNREAASVSSYTIVRPGGLEEPKKNEVLGPSALEITQGDVLAGIISRADVAEVCVELAASTASNLRNTALELYYTDSTVPVSGQFKSMVTSGVVPRLHGDTYDQLLSGIQPNIDCYQS